MDPKDEVIHYLQSENKELASDLEWSEAKIDRLKSKLANYDVLLAMSESERQKTVAELRELVDSYSVLKAKYARLVKNLIALVAQDGPPPPQTGLPGVGSPHSPLGGLLAQGLADYGYIKVRRVDPDDD